jgi:hypothetical protein
MPGDTPESTAIESAYNDQVQSLFKSLVFNLLDAPGSHQTEQQCVSKFVTGFGVAKRARVLALKAVAAAPGDGS